MMLESCQELLTKTSELKLALVLHLGMMGGHACLCL